MEVINHCDDLPCLMDYVRALEGKESKVRGQQVLTMLKTLGLQPDIQKCRWPRIRNIVLDFSPGSSEKQLIFTAHYDVVRGSPGANDNASGVAVLLGLSHQLRCTRVPVRIIFFDREEVWLRTPLLRLGLLGSLRYVFSQNLRNIDAVYNLEFCGSGDFLAVWPLKSTEMNIPAFKEIEKVANKLKIPFRSAYLPWLFLTSDHLSFRLRGFANAITLSLLPQNQIPVLENMLSNLSLLKLLTGRRPLLPEPLSSIHSNKDTSSKLNENSLRLMTSILKELIIAIDFKHDVVRK